MDKNNSIQLEADTGERLRQRVVGAIGRSRQIVGDVVDKMAAEYASGDSLKLVGSRYGFSAAGVLKAFRRSGIKTRNAKEAGLISGPKHGGDLHWTRINPPPCKPETYKLIRVVDADGAVHKRRKHVIVVEKIIGRRLYAHECVHHVDGDKHNNDPENLKLMTKSEHAQYEARLSHQKYPEKYKRKIDLKTGRFLKEK